MNFELFIYQIILEKKFPQNVNQHNCFQTDNNKKYLLNTKSAY